MGEKVRNLGSSLLGKFGRNWQLEGNLAFSYVQTCQQLLEMWLIFWEINIFSSPKFLHASASENEMKKEMSRDWNRFCTAGAFWIWAALSSFAFVILLYLSTKSCHLTTLWEIQVSFIGCSAFDYEAFPGKKRAEKQKSWLQNFTCTELMISATVNVSPSKWNIQSFALWRIAEAFVPLIQYMKGQTLKQSK